MLNNIVSLQQRILEFAGNLPYATLDNVWPDEILVAMKYGAIVIAIVRLRTSQEP